MKKYYYITALLILITSINSITFSQVDRKDKAVYIDSKNAFMDSIKSSLDKFYKKETLAKKSFKLDFSTVNAPASINDFKKYWHSKPISQ